MSRLLTRPFFPNPTPEYSFSHQAEIQRAFELLVRQIQNPGDERFTTLVLTNLPENDAGLELGSVFDHNGFLKIAKVNAPHPAGNVGTTALGTVTVTIT